MEKIADYTKAKSAAQDILNKYKVDEPIVPVFDIAKKEGLSIELFRPTEKLKNVAGFFDPKSKTIYVNDDDPPNRKTFTIAHELAHHILNHKDEEIGILPRWPEIQNQVKSPIEQEANCFAAELLVPKEMLNVTKQKYNLTDKDIDLLSRIFGVSKEVMTYRLKYA